MVKNSEKIDIGYYQKYRVEHDIDDEMNDMDIYLEQYFHEMRCQLSIWLDGLEKKYICETVINLIDYHHDEPSEIIAYYKDDYDIDDDVNIKVIYSINYLGYEFFSVKILDFEDHVLEIFNLSFEESKNMIEASLIKKPVETKSLSSYIDYDEDEEEREYQAELEYKRCVYARFHSWLDTLSPKYLCIMRIFDYDYDYGCSGSYTRYIDETYEIIGYQYPLDYDTEICFLDDFPKEYPIVKYLIRIEHLDHDKLNIQTFEPRDNGLFEQVSDKDMTLEEIMTLVGNNLTFRVSVNDVIDYTMK